jgi:steroid 5-alpha reductase family enzyme
MNYFITLGLLLFVYMSLWFVVSLIKKRNDVADIGWGLGFVLMAWFSFFLSDNIDFRGLLVCILVSIWGFRLAWHIYSRNKSKTEDYRYLAWRQEWGKWFYVRSYFQVYILQGIFLFIIVMPVLLINKNIEIAFGFFDFLGVIFWLVGFFFEVVGDLQLARFIKDPANKGRLMKSGLWAYTRHPNYFGEVTQWWGIWFIALNVPNGWLGIIGPLTITFLILKVSGIPMLEKKMSENPDFREYKRKVSMFIPMLPRK